MVLVVLPLATILNALRIRGKRDDWRRVELETLNRALHDLGVFALRHIGGRWERTGHLQVSAHTARSRRFGPRRAKISVEEYFLRRDGIRLLSPGDDLSIWRGMKGRSFQSRCSSTGSHHPDGNETPVSQSTTSHLRSSLQHPHQTSKTSLSTRPPPVTSTPLSSTASTSPAACF